MFTIHRSSAAAPTKLPQAPIELAVDTPHEPRLRGGPQGFLRREPPDTAVFANTGCKVNTIEEILKIADGAVVGTTFKKDGKFENRVDKSRVIEFMDKVHAVRK